MRAAAMAVLVRSQKRNIERKKTRTADAERELTQLAVVSHRNHQKLEERF